MADQISSQQPMESTSSTTTTVTIDATDSQHSQDVPTVHLKLRKPKTDRKVQWTTETVDNEDMDKKKSKCCCIYKKQRAFGESSSDESSDDECDSCMGHVERKKKMTNIHQNDSETQNQTDIPCKDVTEEKQDNDPDMTEPEKSGPS